MWEACLGALTVAGMGAPAIDVTAALALATAAAVPPPIAAALIPRMADGAAEGFQKRSEARDGGRGEGDRLGEHS